jgi:anti-sigma factor RsiW
MTGSRESCPDGWDPAELLAYLEGDLNPADARKLDEHLRTCVECSAELESLRRLDLLLKRHPESFHLEKEELYRLASRGEDAPSQIEPHIQSCPECKEELELLREMITLRESGDVSPIELPLALVREFELIHGAGEREESPTGGLRAWWRKLVDIPTSVPILTLGTAAAALVIAVFAVPLWKTYIEKAPNLRVTPETVAPAQKPAELSSGIQEAQPRVEGAPPGVAQELRKINAPRRQLAAQAPKVGGKPVEETRERVKSGKPETFEGRLSGDSPASVGPPPRETAFPAAPPVQEPKLELESRAAHPGPAHGNHLAPPRYDDEVARTREADGQQKSEKKLRETRPAQGLADATARIPVEVRIIDAQGRDLEGITFVPPADKRHAYIRGTLERKKEKAPAKTSPADLKPNERIVIRVTGEGGTHDLEGQLFSGDSVVPEKTVKVERVGKDDLTRSIQDLVSCLIPGGSDVHVPDKPGN